MSNSNECGRCHRCGRVLKNPAFVALGYGKTCAAKLGISVTSTGKIKEGGQEITGPVGPVALTEITCRLDGNGEAVTNVPHRIVRHSPAGFSWGYQGSGPAELALNALACVIGQERTEPLYQEFKRDFIAPLPEEGGTILVSDVLAWVEKAEAGRKE